MGPRMLGRLAPQNGRLRVIWDAANGSVWPIPAAMTALSAALAFGFVELDQAGLVGNRER